MIEEGGGQKQKTELTELRGKTKRENQDRTRVGRVQLESASAIDNRLDSSSADCGQTEVDELDERPAGHFKVSGTGRRQAAIPTRRSQTDHANPLRQNNRLLPHTHTYKRFRTPPPLQSLQTPL